MKPESDAAAPRRVEGRFIRIVRTASEVAHAAVLTWILFLVLQAVALHFVVEGF